ncbi:unnamed protein product [Lathyrus sativus]|nr:unnamed protein product [Lathyrus sativus]
MSPPNLPMGKPYSFLMNKERPVSGQNSLKVKKESHKITKNAPLPIPQKLIKQIVEPRIIYTVPQRVIHVSPKDFKDVVQSLTGMEQPTGVSKVSPAARLAWTGETSPEKKEKSSCSNGDDDMTRMLDTGVQMGQLPGILLPVPEILPPKSYENFLPPVLPQMQYNNFLPPVLPQNQYNNFLLPTLTQNQYNNFLPPTLPQNQYNNFSPLTTSEIFSQTNLPPIASDTFLRDTWQKEPSDIFSPVTLPQSDIFSPRTLPPTQPDNFLPDNWQPWDILSPPVTLPPTMSDNLLPDNWQPSDILFADTWQPSDSFSPVALPPTQSDICSTDTWQPSDILSPDTLQPSDVLSADTWEPSDILSPPSTQSDTFSTDPWQRIQPDIYSPAALPQTTSDTWLSSNTFSPETLQPKPYEVFSPVLSYADVRHENNILAKPPEFVPADIVPRQRPNQFNYFHYG